MSNARFSAIIEKLKAEGKYDPTRRSGSPLMAPAPNGHQMNIASTPTLTPNNSFKPMSTIKPIVTPAPLKLPSSNMNKKMKY